MGLGNGKYTKGNQGSGFNFELRLLELQGMIIAAVTGAACCPTASTEATLQQVLSALQVGQEFEQNLIIDQGGVGCPANCPTYLQVKIWNTVTHTFDPPVYYDAAGSLVIPIGPLVLVNPQYVLDNILVQLTAINSNTSSVNKTPGFTIDTTSIVAIPTPVGVSAFSLLFRGTGGELNGFVVPDGYKVAYGNGEDPITVAMTYLRPTAGTGMEVLISTLS